jgi:hypothetical protein
LFFRLSFTTAFVNVAVCYLRNIKTHPLAPLTGNEIPTHSIPLADWMNGPRLSTATSNINPFVRLGDLIPSRFALAASVHTRVSFIPLDYELVDFTSVNAVGIGYFTDYGDDVVGRVDEDDDNFGNLSSATWAFLNAVL